MRLFVAFASLAALGSAVPAFAVPAGTASAAVLRAPVAPSYHGEAQLLVDEPDLLGAMRTVIRGAKASLLVDYYIFGGAGGAELARLLAERHQEGVRVEVLLDAGLGVMPAVRAQTEPVLAALRHAGIPVRLWAGSTRVGARACDHNKLIVADEAEAIVSSMNMGGALIASHDAGVWITGGAARSLAREFRTAFDALSHPPDRGRGVGAERGAPFVRDAIRFAAISAAAGGPSLEVARPVGPSTRGEARIGVVPTEPAHPSWAEARQTVVSALADARQAVEVELLKLTDPWAIEALAGAARRGVKVRVLLDPGHHGRVVPGGLAPNGLYNLAAASQLAAAGAEVRWYVPRAHELALHVKAARIDGRRLLIGSTNWTTDGFVRNRETLLDIRGGAAPGQFGPVFESAWSERSEPITFAWGPISELQLALYRGLTALAD